MAPTQPTHATPGSPAQGNGEGADVFVGMIYGFPLGLGLWAAVLVPFLVGGSLATVGALTAVAGVLFGLLRICH